MTTTLYEITHQRHSRIKSASPRADIGLYNEGGHFACYLDDADKVKEWLAGTGLCTYTDPSPEPWEYSMAQCIIPLAAMDKAVQIILTHASVALVDHISERSVPQFICFLFLKRTAAPAVAGDPLGDVF